MRLAQNYLGFLLQYVESDSDIDRGKNRAVHIAQAKNIVFCNFFSSERLRHNLAYNFGVSDQGLNFFQGTNFRLIS